MRTEIVILSISLIALLPQGAQGQSPKSNSEKKVAGTNAGKAQKKTDKKVERGQKLFATHCASCHADGGNVVTPSKPVKGSHVLATLATFKSYLNEPVGNMPHYERLITDDKLLEDLHAYAKSLDKQRPSPSSDKAKDSQKKTEKSK